MKFLNFISNTYQKRNMDDTREEEQNDVSDGQKQCKKCNQALDPSEGLWKEYSSYSVKLVKCPDCGCMNVVRILEDKGLFVNFDKRYYN